jgi:hypothetical protein
MRDAPPRKLLLTVALLALLGYLAFRLFDRPGDPFYRLRELRRGAVGVGRGEYSAPDSTALVGLALLVGAPVLGFGTIALRRRLLSLAGEADTGMAKGCAGLLAGAVLFTFVAPLVLVRQPGIAILVGGAFALRVLTLLPRRGRPARTRKALLAGIALYWFLYWSYETAMARWSATVSGAIRVDLLLWVPLLFFVTAAGVWLAFDRRSGTPEAAAG